MNGGERAEQKRERSQQATPNPADGWQQEKDEIRQMGILHVTCRHVC